MATLLLSASGCRKEIILPIGECTFTVTETEPLTLTYDDIVDCAGEVIIELGPPMGSV